MVVDDRNRSAAQGVRPRDPGEDLHKRRHQEVEVVSEPVLSNHIIIMKPASEKRMRAWSRTRFWNFQLANSGRPTDVI